MDIYINNAKADITLEDEKTIEDVLKGIETECEKMDAGPVLFPGNPGQCGGYRFCYDGNRYCQQN